MSFPSSHHVAGLQPASAPAGAAAPRTLAQSGARPGASGPLKPPVCQLLPMEGDHQLEKLEFALAIALTRGDAQRSRQLREEIDRLGGNREEPGT